MRINTQAEPNVRRNPADKLPVCNVKVQAGKQLITAASTPAPPSDELHEVHEYPLKADSCRTGHAGERCLLRGAQRETL